MFWMRLICIVAAANSYLLAQKILVEPVEFNQYLNDSTMQKLDVRSGAEFELVGHLPDFDQVSIFDPKFDEKALTHFNPDRPILVTCFSGHRSITAVERLTKLGFKKIIELKGGLIRWMQKGYELE